MSYRTADITPWAKRYHQSQSSAYPSSQPTSRLGRRASLSGTTATLPPYHSSSSGLSTSTSGRRSSLSGTTAALPLYCSSTDTSSSGITDSSQHRRRSSSVSRARETTRQQYGIEQTGLAQSVASTLRPEDSISNAGVNRRRSNNVSRANPASRQQRYGGEEYGAGAYMPPPAQLARDTHGSGRQTRRNSVSSSRGVDSLAREMELMRVAADGGHSGTSMDSSSRYGRRNSISRLRSAAARGMQMLRVGAYGSRHDSSTFGPLTLAASTLGPSTLGPSTLSPSTLDCSTLAPSTWSPSTLGSSTFGPSTLGPSTLGPSTLSPSSLARRPRRLSDAGSSEYTRPRMPTSDQLLKNGQSYKHGKTYGSWSWDSSLISNDSSELRDAKRYNRRRSTSSTDYSRLGSVSSNSGTHYPPYSSISSLSNGSSTHYSPYPSTSSGPSSGYTRRGPLSSGSGTRYPPYSSISSMSSGTGTRYPDYGSVSSGSSTHYPPYSSVSSGYSTDYESTRAYHRENATFGPYATPTGVEMRFGVCYNPRLEDLAKNF